MPFLHVLVLRAYVAGLPDEEWSEECIRAHNGLAARPSAWALLALAPAGAGRRYQAGKSHQYDWDKLHSGEVCRAPSESMLARPKA
ncbi:hypothetical protein FRC07_006747, partial [Ceratobasidium sp. 392]